MIDAYEIGIQLALQDDVSAGLQVINQGLAEVDRAIDATSAKLINLTNAAQGVAGVAAASGAMRSAVVSDRRAPESAKEPGTGEINPSRDQDPPALSLPSSPTPALRQTDPTSSVVQTQAAPTARSEQAKSDSAPSIAGANLPGAGREPDQTSAAPIVQIQQSIEPLSPSGPARQTTLPERQRTDPGAKSASPIQVPPAASVANRVAPQTSSTRSERIFTASVAQATAPAKTYSGSRGVSRPPVRPSEPLAEPAGRATAPWSGIETRALTPQPLATAERPAAPQGRQQDRSEGMTGSVMLDGHLVGQWLADQMAKDASRPPSGTSFFDPRQTPAWSASGSL